MLRQNTTEAQTIWPHAAPRSNPRFDKDNVTDILEAAARLQKAEQETLTQAEIEMLAAEMRIAPRHVRQAIALSRQRATHSRRLRPVHLSLQQKLVASFVPLLFGSYIATLDYAMPGPAQFSLLFSLYVLPFAVSAVLGVLVRYKRAGVILGTYLYAALYGGVIFGTSARGMSLHFLNEHGARQLLAMWIGPIVSGIVGAALNQWLVMRKESSALSVNSVSTLDR